MATSIAYCLFCMKTIVIVIAIDLISQILPGFTVILKLKIPVTAPWLKRRPELETAKK